MKWQNQSEETELKENQNRKDKREPVIGRTLREMEGERCGSVRATALHSKRQRSCRWTETEWQRDKDRGRERERESVKPCTADMRYKSPGTRWQISTGSICCTSAGTQHTPSIPTHRSWVCTYVTVMCVCVCMCACVRDHGVGREVSEGREVLQQGRREETAGERMKQVGDELHRDK